MDEKRVLVMGLTRTAVSLGTSVSTRMQQKLVVFPSHFKPLQGALKVALVLDDLKTSTTPSRGLKTPSRGIL